jgi:hypothetical protein
MGASRAFFKGLSEDRRYRRVAWHALGVYLSVLGGIGGPALVRPSRHEAYWVAMAGGLAGLAIAWYLALASYRERERRKSLPVSDPVSRDPGRPVSSLFAGLLIFPLRGRAKAAAKSQPQLTVLRILFLAFAGALPLYWFVLSFVLGKPRHGHTQAAVPFAAGVAVLGAVALMVSSRLSRRVIEADRSQALTTYRSMFFLRVAYVEAVPLFAFAGTFVTHSPWLFPLALACSVPAFLVLAPSARNLQRIDEARRLRGAAGSIYEELLTLPAPPSPPLGAA